MFVFLNAFLSLVSLRVNHATSYVVDKRGSDATKVTEPLLKTAEFQGVCGTSKLIGPEIVVSGIPTEREIPRAAVVFENKIGGGKFGDVSIAILTLHSMCHVSAVGD